LDFLRGCFYSASFRSPREQQREKPTTLSRRCPTAGRTGGTGETIAIYQVILQGELQYRFFSLFCSGENCLSDYQNRAVGHFWGCHDNWSGCKNCCLAEPTFSPLGLVLENLLRTSCMVKLLHQLVHVSLYHVKFIISFLDFGRTQAITLHSNLVKHDK